MPQPDRPDRSHDLNLSLLQSRSQVTETKQQQDAGEKWQDWQKAWISERPSSQIQRNSSQSSENAARRSLCPLRYIRARHMNNKDPKGSDTCTHSLENISTPSDPGNWMHPHDLSLDHITPDDGQSSSGHAMDVPIRLPSPIFTAYYMLGVDGKQSPSDSSPPLSRPTLMTVSIFEALLEANKVWGGRLSWVLKAVKRATMRGEHPHEEGGSLGSSRLKWKIGEKPSAKWGQLLQEIMALRSNWINTQEELG